MMVERDSFFSFWKVRNDEIAIQSESLVEYKERNQRSVDYFSVVEPSLIRILHTCHLAKEEDLQA
jgi:hypothetical protein